MACILHRGRKIVVAGKRKRGPNGVRRREGIWVWGAAASAGRSVARPKRCASEALRVMRLKSGEEIRRTGKGGGDEGLEEGNRLGSEIREQKRGVVGG